jgi:hypothetical protein
VAEAGGSGRTFNFGRRQTPVKYALGASVRFKDIPDWTLHRKKTAKSARISSSTRVVRR